MIHLFVNNNDHESPERRGDRKETDDKQEKVNFRQFAKQISIATYILTYNNDVTTIKICTVKLGDKERFDKNILVLRNHFS